MLGPQHEDVASHIFSCAASSIFSCAPFPVQAAKVAALDESMDVDNPVILEPEASKEKRTAVHQCVRKHFPKLESDSIRVGEATSLRVFVRSDGGAAGGRGGGNDRPNKRQRGGGAGRGGRGDSLWQGQPQFPPNMRYVPLPRGCARPVSSAGVGAALWRQRAARGSSAPQAERGARVRAAR